MAENTVTRPVGSAEPLEELDAIYDALLRGMSLLRVLARAVAGVGDAELEESLRIATEHFDGARNRMERALVRLAREQRA